MKIHSQVFDLTHRGRACSFKCKKYLIITGARKGRLLFAPISDSGNPPAKLEFAAEIMSLKIKITILPIFTQK